MSSKGVRIVGALCGLAFGWITGSLIFAPVWILLFAVVIAPLFVKTMAARTSPLPLIGFWGVLALLCLWFGDGIAATLMVLLGLVFLGIKIAIKATQTTSQSKFGEGYRYAFLGGNTGIAVDPERRMVKLKNGSLEQAFSFADVRGWERKLLSGGAVVGRGRPELAWNLMNSDANEQGSGVFVQVRNVDRPEWRIAILDVHEQQRWMEIMEQSINEPVASGPAPASVNAARLP